MPLDTKQMALLPRWWFSQQFRGNSLQTRICSRSASINHVLLNLGWDCNLTRKDLRKNIRSGKRTGPKIHEPIFPILVWMSSVSSIVYLGFYLANTGGERYFVEPLLLSISPFFRCFIRENFLKQNWQDNWQNPLSLFSYQSSLLLFVYLISIWRFFFSQPWNGSVIEEETRVVASRMKRYEKKVCHLHRLKPTRRNEKTPAKLLAANKPVNQFLSSRYILWQSLALNDANQEIPLFIQIIESTLCRNGNN